MRRLDAGRGSGVQPEVSGEAHPIDLTQYCQKYEQAMSMLGKRWTGLILRALLAGETRFSTICAYVPGLSDRLLSERLKELETDNVIERRVFAETPVRIEYALTAKGAQLREIVEAVQTWADVWVPLAGEPGTVMVESKEVRA